MSQAINVETWYDNRLYQHVHQPAKVYPSLADPIPLVSATGAAWDVGTITEIIPASTITTWFDVHFINISSIDAVDDYELILYKGGAGSEEEIGRIAFSRSSTFAQEGNRPIQIAPLPPNTRVSAALACGDGDGAACNVKLYYHQYT